MANSAWPRLPRLQPVVARTLLLGWVLAQVAGAAGTPDKAYNLTWKSTNFKTVLEWEPKPVNHVYTVQISYGSEDWKSKCFSVTATECDLTDEIIEDVKKTYEARVLTHLPTNPDTSNSFEELPSANSPKFTPYLETKLGQPAIQSFEQVGPKLNVTVQDTRTLIRRNGTFLTLRDVFGQNLNYTLYYWKALSTGKKTATTNTNGFLIDVDEGKEYCFSVQAVISSRKTNQKSPESPIVCTRREKGIFKEMFFIVGAVVLLVIICVIILPLSLYKCRRARAQQSGKENSPLNVM